MFIVDFLEWFGEFFFFEGLMILICNFGIFFKIFVIDWIGGGVMLKFLKLNGWDKLCLLWLLLFFGDCFL